MSTSSMSPYVKVREIGRGTYGTVYLGKRRTDDQVVAIKEVHKSRLLNVQSLRIEIEVMKKLKGHPNVLNLYDYYESPMLMGLVLELCEGGEIFDAITERGRLAESEAKWVAAQALSALAFCHENNICHRDIKPQNILLKRKVDSRTLLLDRQRGQRAVVCDFGVSKSYRKNERLRKLIGTTSYMAPEMFQRSYEGPEVDMYAMGVVLFQMMTGSKPFASVRDVQVNYARSLQSAFARRVDFWKTHPECASLIRVLLRERATDRPSAKRALSHPWFATRRGAGTTAEKDAGDCEIFSGKEGRLALSALRSAQKHRRFKRDFVMTLATRITSSSVLKGQDDGALVRAFRALDIDGDGFVTPSEVTTALGSRIGSAASREVAAMLVRHDLDGDGRFSYRELLVCALERAASNSTSRDDLGSLMRRAGVSESRIGHVLQEHSQHERNRDGGASLARRPPQLCRGRCGGPAACFAKRP
eukprot:g4070.t1